jgi:uroporphyrinogen-III decarboxylase
MAEILRDEYLDYMTGRAVRRPLFAELFGPLVGLDEQWRSQGAREDEIDLTAFGFDHCRRHHVQYCLRWDEEAPPPEILEENDEHIIQRDSLGRRIKLVKGVATIPHPLDYPVKTLDDWLAIKPRYQFREELFTPGWAEAARTAREQGALIVCHMPGGFDEPRQLLGEEGLCMAFYDQPELIADILETLAETAERVFEIVTDEVQVDQLSVHEDMAGKSGPLIGPDQVREWINPYYRRCWQPLAERGATIFDQDSDGNMNPVIDAFLESGLNSMHPFEPAAGMDIVAVKKRLGSRLMIRGGIDKHVLRRSPEEIRAELEYKLQPMMRRGGVVFSLDHRIPNGTPIENYRFYVRTAREILGLEPDPEPGWGRMAF